MLRAIARILRPDGIAVITVPNDPLIARLKGAIRRTPVGLAMGSRINWGGDRYHLHRWTPRQLNALLEKVFHVSARRDAPAAVLPVRVCFRCVGLATGQTLGQGE